MTMHRPVVPHALPAGDRRWRVRKRVAMATHVLIAYDGSDATGAAIGAVSRRFPGARERPPQIRIFVATGAWEVRAAVRPPTDGAGQGGA